MYDAQIQIQLTLTITKWKFINLNSTFTGKLVLKILPPDDFYVEELIIAKNSLSNDTSKLC